MDREIRIVDRKCIHIVNYLESFGMNRVLPQIYNTLYYIRIMPKSHYVRQLYNVLLAEKIRNTKRKEVRSLKKKKEFIFII